MGTMDGVSTAIPAADIMAMRAVEPDATRTREVAAGLGGVVLVGAAGFVLTRPSPPPELGGAIREVRRVPDYEPGGHMLLRRLGASAGLAGTSIVAAGLGAGTG